MQGNPMITAAFLRERAAYYRQLAETPEIQDHADDLRALAAAFERDAVEFEQLKMIWPDLKD
jgi:hypothetical protein